MRSIDEIRDKVQATLKETNHLKTYEHILAVADTSKKIALQYGLITEISVASALLHDISIIMSPDSMLEYAITHRWEPDEAEREYPFLLHQRLSAVMAKERYGVHDDRILNAISCHTTLKANPTAYDMVLFISDKLSWDQSGVPPFYDMVKRKLEISLEAASYAYIRFILDKKMVLFPHHWLLEAEKYLMKKIQ